MTSSSKSYVLFLGCTIPARAQNFEISARKVAATLGIEFGDVPEFGCCGYPLSSVNPETPLLMAARNLALAEKAGADLCTLCTACTGSLTEAAHRLDHNAALLDQVNTKLAEIGLKYSGGVRVRHFSRLMIEEVGLDAIRAKATNPLKDFRIAPHYGCHYLKPSAAYDDFDDVENPRTVDQIIEAIGATSVDYPGKLRCCGGGVLAIDETVALKVTKNKLDAVRDAGADAIALICPFCSIMYDTNQKKIESMTETEYQIPVLFLTQVMGLAFGIHPKELGLQMNRVKVAPLLKKIGAL
ncbi:MAG: CoB--CoM heterodisulfide reductase iron-sulfur subunit B family protein [Planctomycetota bacterium]